ncbi:VOC family protein [Paenibacillus nasutitermitis]|uniref:Glyoxalase/fosfomycin resistance/dioxygenase domain-containing protein n=1 Tax=Paenibacillus nasutitermitis TaxID=1652958 RepID=A0A916ZAC6_9BACL|nr:VOC family protein [Paenibacillus nasutitermitis]GGD83064.1 hypothetical protein GCM10010911_46590 [Paenibacillus nasutitermitis]
MGRQPFQGGFRFSEHARKHQVGRASGKLFVRGKGADRGTEWYKPVVMLNAAKLLFGGMDMSNSEQEKPSKSVKQSPIKNKVGDIFVPVRDIERSREWYCRLLGLNADCEIMNGHLCPLPMEGSGLILDTMPMWGGKEPGGAPNIKTPAFMLMTDDLQASYDFAKANDVTLVTGIQDNHWFVIKDPDDNLLMICRE